MKKILLFVVICAGMISENAMAKMSLGFGLNFGSWFGSNKLSYCFAFWAPHGRFWQDQCYDSKKDCATALAERKDMGLRLNTDKCYRGEFTDAYCVGAVDTGRIFHTDDDAYVPWLTTVCAKKLSDCQKYEKYTTDNSHCEKEKNIKTREGEGLYITPAAELEKIDTNGRVHSGAVKASSDGCVNYIAAPDQERAFENLGLDWSRTKTWGAFVDVNGDLRANRPSCRLIERDSREYNRYKK